MSALESMIRGDRRDSGTMQRAEWDRLDAAHLSPRQRADLALEDLHKQDAARGVIYDA